MHQLIGTFIVLASSVTIPIYATPLVSDSAIALAPLSISTVSALADAAAAEHGIDPQRLKNTLWGESSYQADAVGDMKLLCRQGPFRGLPVRARGLAQITRCYHPEVSDFEAFSPRFAVDWMAEEIAEGHGCRESSVYRKLYC